MLRAGSRKYNFIKIMKKEMEIIIAKDNKQLGREAGQQGARFMKEAIKEKGEVNIILATGTSQFETLRTLIEDKEIDWSKVVMFHLDEYIGISIDHKASFRKYLKERVLAHLPDLKDYHLIDGEGDPEKECERLNDIIADHTIDVAFVGIGENAHLAFNDHQLTLKQQNHLSSSNSTKRAESNKWGEVGLKNWKTYLVERFPCRSTISWTANISYVAYLTNAKQKQ